MIARLNEIPSKLDQPPTALPIVLATEGHIAWLEGVLRKREQKFVLSGSVLDTTQGLDPGRVGTQNSSETNK